MTNILSRVMKIRTDPSSCWNPCSDCPHWAACWCCRCDLLSSCLSLLPCVSRWRNRWHCAQSGSDAWRCRKKVHFVLFYKDMWRLRRKIYRERRAGGQWETVQWAVFVTMEVDLRRRGIMRQELRQSEAGRWEAGGLRAALHSSQPTMGRWSMMLSSGRSKRSPNHINHRLTLGSSPAIPTVFNKGLNAQYSTEY